MNAIGKGGDKFNLTRYHTSDVSPVGANDPLASSGSTMVFSKFTHINQAFTCMNCGREVPPRTSGCRNHCPYCLTSRHVDINPGDRANNCEGLMDAVGYELNAKKGVVLIFRCRRCQQVSRNMAANEDPNTPDNYDLILTLNRPLTGR